ncbi:TorD/DmsD family molecular chaperone [Paradesulfitobacterium ferrireducens]|uniref:TorD/DmsD family molecular chaperone n=1 Tax=Paradesulfitobacterium ferrireducens TaxID=2816476 RepID=UPI001A8F5BDC|nr:molecular chaperone TorD family protein [Paradesulfitobacterium ferrireducens]
MSTAWVYQPNPKSLFKGMSNIFMALSRFFAAGGEQIARTLPLLAQACEEFAAADTAWPALAATLSAYAGAAETEQKQMGFEFNRLFVGPAPPIAPPYESVHLSAQRLVMQEQTVAVRRCYQAADLQATSQGAVPDDFIATELEFAAYLLSRALEENSAGNEGNSLHYVDFCATFLTEHPGCWVEPFAAAVNQNARHPVFPAVMQVLLTAIKTPLTIDII